MPDDEILPPQPGDSTDKGGGTATETKTDEGGDKGGKTEQPDPLMVDIQATIEKARKDEKDKQFKTIEGLKTEASAKDSTIAQLQETLGSLTKQLEEAKATAAPEPKPDDKGGETPPGITEEKMNAAVDAAVSNVLERAENEIFGPKLTKLEEENAALRESIKQNEITAYKQDLIEANKASIIPELVTGSTKEELDESLVTAKQVFARTAKSFEDRRDTAVDDAETPLVPLPSTNTGEGGQSPDPNQGVPVSKMSDEEYESNRADLLRSASEAARRSLSNSD